MSLLPEFHAVMLADWATSVRAALFVAFLGLALCAHAQTATSPSFSLESSLLTGAARSVSASFTAETCVAPGMGGVSSSTNFGLTTGCGAMMTLSDAERSALGLVPAAAEPVVVPTLAGAARLMLPVSMILAGWLALRFRRKVQGINPLRSARTPG